MIHVVKTVDTFDEFILSGEVAVVLFYGTTPGALNDKDSILAYKDFCDLAKKYKFFAFVAVDYDDEACKELLDQEDVYCVPVIRIYKYAAQLSELLGGSTQDVRDMLDKRMSLEWGRPRPSQATPEAQTE